MGSKPFSKVSLSLWPSPGSQWRLKPTTGSNGSLLSSEGCHCGLKPSPCSYWDLTCYANSHWILKPCSGSHWSLRQYPRSYWYIKKFSSSHKFYKAINRFSLGSHWGLRPLASYHCGLKLKLMSKAFPMLSLGLKALPRFFWCPRHYLGPQKCLHFFSMLSQGL